MGILGAVTVAATTVVKVAAIVGMAWGGFDLMVDAFNLLIPNGYSPGIEEMALPAARFIGGLAGWQFADWVNGKVHVIENQARQQAELDKLQAHHGVAL